MKNGRSVRHGTKGDRLFETVPEGLTRARKVPIIGRNVGSSELAPNVIGASRGPSGLARGNATAPNAESVGLQTADPEVKVRKRRYLTRGYKLGILKQVDKLKGKDGALGEFLRKEGLYTATLSQWRKQRNEGFLGQTRGRKSTPAETIENERLTKENRRLRDKIGQYQLVIEAQKKISEILGVRQDNVPPMPDLDENE